MPVTTEAPTAQRSRRRAPFWLRRPALVVRDLLAARNNPDLEALAGIDDPESFVWAILPHAARTFSACIALLPERSAKAAAVGYLYCRMLDTYEDLVPDLHVRDRALAEFAVRLDVAVSDPTAVLAPAPEIDEHAAVDARDRAHLLLVHRAALVDRMFETLDQPTRVVVRDLVRDMAEGMRWSSATMAAEGGVLVGDESLSQYCRHVLGNPVVFAIRLVRLASNATPDLSPAEVEDAMCVGEMVQLANVTRDIEKDLTRGVAYDASLRTDLERVANARNGDPHAVLHADPGLRERCRVVRERLVRRALAHAPAYGRMISAMRLPRWSAARGSAVLMLLFTERYFRGCLRRVGRAAWEGPDATLALLMRTLSAAVSRRRAKSEIERIERAFVDAAQAS